MIRKILEQLGFSPDRTPNETPGRLKSAWGALFTSRGVAPFSVRVPRWQVALRQSFKRLINPDRGNIVGTFDPLTPVRLQGKEYSRYSAELERALRLPKVRNIAITGSYGAGKSSFIQSFVEDHSEYNFCFVSLASFSEIDVVKDAVRIADGGSSDDGGHSPDSDGSKSFADVGVDALERIESSIVQQLLYSVRDSSIPQTRLKRINHVRAGTALLYSIFVAAASAAALALFGLPKGLSHLTIHFPFNYILEAIPGLCVAGIAVGLVAIIYSILSSVLGFRLHAVAIKGMSLARSSVMSVLHKQLDEIVYLFERNRIDIVMIEDLDRFNDSSPFTRLREINFIVNSSPSIRRPVHFIYMVRDDLFSSRDRVKFFDCVIPIVSVINTDNSQQKMLDIMAARGWAPDVCPSKYVIESVSYHVDDMRLLVNILNEYDLMRSIIGRNATLNKDKMFAAVVSRCLFPREYAELLRGQGVISDLLSSYAGWSKERREELQLAVRDLESKVSMQPQELAATEKELRALIWLAASEREVGYPLLSIEALGGSAMNFRDFVRDGFDEAANLEDALSLDFGPAGSRRVEYRELLGKGQGSLGSRMIAAREIASGSARRLSEMRKKVSDFSFTALSQAIRDPAFVAHVAKKSSELKLGPVGFFITKGLLGEDYFDYSGYFYAGSISRSDKELMLRVKAGELLPVESRIDDPAEFLKRMNAAELREGRGILVPIVFHLFGDKYDGGDFKADLRSVIFGDSHLYAGRVGELVRALLAEGNRIGAIEYLLVNYPSVMIEAVEPGAECGVAPWREKLIARALSVANQLKGLIGGDLHESLREIVSSITDGAEFVSSITDFSQAKSWLDESEVWLYEIDEVLEIEVMERLLSLNAPAVNAHNMRSLGRFFDPPLAAERIGLASIRAQAEGSLKGWLERNYGNVLESIIEQDGDLSEDSSDVKWIISHVSDDLALELRSMERLSFEAQSTDGFPERLWARMLIKKRLAATWENMEAALSSASDEEQQEIVTSILSSQRSLDLLADDADSLDDMGISRIVAIVERMIELSDNSEDILARFLANSGVAMKLPDEFIPKLSQESMRSMMDELDGHWCEWLWVAVDKDADPLLARYLASCADDPGSRQGVSAVPAQTLVAAASLLTTPAAVEQLIMTFIARVTGWDQDSANSACRMIGLSDISRSGAASRILSEFYPLPMFEEASIDSSCQLLARVVGKMEWSEVKEIMSVASHSALVGLSGEKGEVTLAGGKGTDALVGALHSAGLIRKPKRRRGDWALAAAAKY